MAVTTNNGWVRAANSQEAVPHMGLKPPPTVDDRKVPKVCCLCREATPTFIDEHGNGTCDPCTWAATAPYYVGKGDATFDMTGEGRKAGLRMEGVEYHVVRRSDGRSMGSRRGMREAFDLCGWWNRGHEIDEGEE